MAFKTLVFGLAVFGFALSSPAKGLRAGLGTIDELLRALKHEPTVAGRQIEAQFFREGGVSNASSTHLVLASIKSSAKPEVFVLVRREVGPTLDQLRVHLALKLDGEFQAHFQKLGSVAREYGDFHLKLHHMVRDSGLREIKAQIIEELSARKLVQLTNEDLLDVSRKIESVKKLGFQVEGLSQNVLLQRSVVPGKYADQNRALDLHYITNFNGQGDAVALEIKMGITDFTSPEMIHRILDTVLEVVEQKL